MKHFWNDWLNYLLLLFQLTLVLAACIPIRELSPLSEGSPNVVGVPVTVEPQGATPTLSHERTALSLTDWLTDFAAERYEGADLVQVGHSFTYTIQLQQEQPMYWTETWCTKDEATLHQNLQRMAWDFSINSQSVANDQFFTVIDRSDANPCYTIQTKVANWPPGQTDLKTVMTFVESLNDGFDDYPAGTQTFLYRILNAPLSIKPAADGQGSDSAVDCVLRSHASRKAVYLTFKNQSQRAVKAYWLDYEGKEVFYFRIAPGSSFSQTTFVTHPWCIRDAITEEVILAIVADDKLDTIVIPGQ